jgi:hypothetical protein
MEVPLKTRNRSAIRSSNTTPRESGYSKSTCTPMFIAAPFTIAKLGNSQDAPLVIMD